ncbi:Uncharacterized protein FKW44_024862, partial [Caligus rogercresseyi]
FGPHQLCLRLSGLEKQGTTAIRRVLWKNLHSPSEAMELLGGFYLTLKPDMCLLEASENFNALLGVRRSGSTLRGRHLREFTSYSPRGGGEQTLQLHAQVVFHGGSSEQHIMRLKSLESVSGNIRLGFQQEEATSLPKAVFSTLIHYSSPDARITRMTCSSLGEHLAAHCFINRSFLELMSSPEEAEYVRGRLRSCSGGLSRVYEMRPSPKVVLWVQSEFIRYASGVVLGHHYVLKESEECIKRKIDNDDHKKKRVVEDDASKNKLLRELLNINSTNRSSHLRRPSDEDGLSSSSARLANSTSSRILQLLNTTNSCQERSDPESNSSSSTMMSSNTSPMCSQNPALANLLSKPPYMASPAIPPPVPTKWHQEPREKLPKARKSPMGTPLRDPHLLLPDEDPTLSEILDGVIEIQERSCSRSGPLFEEPRKAINLSDIEEFLCAEEKGSCLEEEMPPPSGGTPSSLLNNALERHSSSSSKRSSEPKASRNGSLLLQLLSE